MHLGSLYTALAGFLDARSRRGKWLLRIDDLDTPRNVKGAADAILTTLDIFGLVWDDTVTYQSQYRNFYEAILDELTERQLIYPCICSRKSLTAGRTDNSTPDVYPGYCRKRTSKPQQPYALRIKTDHRNISFQDKLQGLISDNLAGQHGDFIVKRKDQIIAYQFAVAVDDHLQKISHVVRGVDLLESTPKQIYLQQILGFSSPEYMHVPVIIDSRGYKLSKQTLAAPVAHQKPQTVMFELLGLLKQSPPRALQKAAPAELLDWAITHWDPSPLANLQAVSQRVF